MNNRLFKGLLLLVFILFTGMNNAVSKEYTIPEIRVSVQVNPDGSLTITEHRTYVFDGSYSWANYTLPKKGFTTIQNIQVLEGGQAFTNSNTEENGTFLVEQSDREINLKWYYSAENEERTFTLRYTLYDALARGPDFAEFFWTYAASGREKSTAVLDIDFNLPESAAPDSISYWVRSPDSDFSARLTENGYQFNASDISRSEAVRIRMIFPASVLNSANYRVTAPNLSLEQARTDEQNFRIEQAERAREEAIMQEYAFIFSALLILLSTGAFIFLYRKYGRRHKVQIPERSSLLIPGKESPAMVSWLYSGRTVTGGAMMSTLFDLGRKRYLILHEIEPEKKISFFSAGSKENTYRIEIDKDMAAHINELESWEKSLLGFIQMRIEGGHEDLKEIFNFQKPEVYKWFNKWKKLVQEEAKELGWMDPAGYKGLTYNLAVQSFLVVSGVAALFLIHPVAFIGLMGALLFLVFSIAMIKRSPKGEEVYRKWKNFYEGLKEAKEHSLSSDELGRQFIYAVALGINKETLTRMFEQNQEAMIAIYWVVIMPGSTGNPADISSSFSTLAATGGSSFGVAGGGVGASAGAAGGGASGGAG